MSESDTSINRLEEIKTIEDKRKQYTVVVRINGIKKEFLKDTESPVAKTPPEGRTMRKTPIFRK